MFNFNKPSFNFNSVLESKFSNAVALSLDDDDDDLGGISSIPTIKRNVIANKTNFNAFLLGKVFNPIDINFDNSNADSRNADKSYAWKEITYEGERHFIAYIYINEKRNSKTYNYSLYIDLNDTTKELNIGNCTSFRRSKYFNISYPLIKICETYTDGPVYISDIYVDTAYSYRESATEILDKIEYPLTHPNITSDISIFRCVWNKKGYYYPDHRPQMKFTKIDKDLILSSTFINHLTGFANKFNGAKVALFYKAFESFEDFAKLTKLFCERGALVFSEFGAEFKDNNVDEVLEEFKAQVDEELGIEHKVNQETAEKERIAKEKLSEMLSPNILQHFDSINAKTPNLLSIRTMFKERKSKDPYRKFDLPVIKLILKDNGIDIEKIVNKYEAEWEDNFYKLVNIFNKHLDNIKCVPSFKTNLASSIFSYGSVLSYYPVLDSTSEEQENDNRKQFDGLTDEEIELIKKLVFGLHVYNCEDGQYRAEVDVSRLNDTSEDSIKMANELLYRIGDYPGSQIGDVSHHVFNEFLLLQRFVYILDRLVVEDYNAKHEDNKQKFARNDALYSMQYNYVSFGYYGDYTPFNCSDIDMKINAYEKLYKFIEYIAFIIENAYNINIPYLGFEECHSYNLLKEHNMAETQKDIIEKEFSFNNKPNMELLDMTSINRCLLTIFTNIDKKI